jgi:peptide-methionine (S)-S-oxide reductase
VVDKAIFGAGCFWQVEAAFRDVPGVLEVTSGYSGGHMPEPSYGDVCSGATGHAEVVEVDYDPDQVSYDTLLDKFWQIHDPTQVNRQGPDVGEQYRSVIFTTTPEQATTAEASKQAHQAEFDGRIATQILPASEFYRAEEYHQRYLERRRGGIFSGLFGH